MSCAPGAVPKPLKPTTCGDGTASSATESMAERWPVAFGANVTAMAQADPGPSVALDPFGQLSVSAKSATFAPVIEMPEMVNGPLPVFCKVTVCGTLAGVPGFCPAKVRLEGVSETPAAVPVPERATVCGEDAALSETETSALRGPVAVG